jgi:hypothetical protein
VFGLFAEYAADNALRVDNSVAFSFQPKALRVMENDL